MFYLIELISPIFHAPSCYFDRYILYCIRFGVGDFDWKEFAPRLKQKTYEEIKEYASGFSFFVYFLPEYVYFICFKHLMVKC